MLERLSSRRSKTPDRSSAALISSLMSRSRSRAKLGSTSSRDTLNNPSARLNFLCVELQSTDLFRPSLAASAVRAATGERHPLSAM